MSVRRKLLLALAPLGLALAVLGVVSVMTISALGRTAETILTANYRSVLAMQRMSEALERIDDDAVLSLLKGRAAALPAMTAQRQAFDAELRVAENNLTEPGEGEAVAKLRAAWSRGGLELERFFGAAAGERATLYHDSLRPTLLDLRATTQVILAINQDAMVHKSEAAQAAARRTSTLMIGASLTTFAVGLAFSLALLARVLGRLQVLTRAVQRVADHDFTTRVEVSGHDELATLAASFNRMAERLAEYRRSSLGELLQAQEASQSAIDSIPDPVLVFDRDGSLLAANQASDRLLGLSAGERGAHPLAGLEPGLRRAVEAARAHVLSGKGSYVPRDLEEAVPLAAADGEHYLLPRGTPVQTDRGSVTGATLILQDVTRLRWVDALRSDLVATTAHELRTPLTSLRMAVHLCLEEAAGPLSAKQSELLHGAREDGERLQATVDELLDLARLQGGKLELRRRQIEIAPVLHSAVESLRNAASDRQIRLDLYVPPFPPAIDGDPDRLQVVVSNLLANAIRHSPAGATVRVVAAGDDTGVRVEVRDEGSGIPEAHRERVFDRFFQIPGEARGSSGLGLSIAREIVLAHGGRIGVVPNPRPGGGEGATLWFSLPGAPAPIV